MMIEIAKIGLPMADEALFTHNDGYVVDLLSWIAIGARSTEDQEHRIFASMVPHPVGIKIPLPEILKLELIQ
jgi:3-deoxy-D-arabino-heptulosonate 7-phosphate (DAHP) synthase